MTGLTLQLFFISLWLLLWLFFAKWTWECLTFMWALPSHPLDFFLLGMMLITQWTAFLFYSWAGSISLIRLEKIQHLLSERVQPNFFDILEWFYFQDLLRIFPATNFSKFTDRIRVRDCPDFAVGLSWFCMISNSEPWIEYFFSLFSRFSPIEDLFTIEQTSNQLHFRKHCIESFMHASFKGHSAWSWLEILRWLKNEKLEGFKSFLISESSTKQVEMAVFEKLSRHMMMRSYLEILGQIWKVQITN